MSEKDSSILRCIFICLELVAFGAAPCSVCTVCESGWVSLYVVPHSDIAALCKSVLSASSEPASTQHYTPLTYPHRHIAAHMTYAACTPTLIHLHTRAHPLSSRVTMETKRLLNRGWWRGSRRQGLTGWSAVTSVQPCPTRWFVSQECKTVFIKYLYWIILNISLTKYTVCIYIVITVVNKIIIKKSGFLV